MCTDDENVRDIVYEHARFRFYESDVRYDLWLVDK